MTINEVFGLRNQGRIEEAYEEARKIYATDKGPYPSAVMFWTAVDMLKKLVIQDHQEEEARKIYAALERLLSNARDGKGWMSKALKNCKQLLEGNVNRQTVKVYPEHILMGDWGEVVAMTYLRDLGYVILTRDWHSRHRDLDLIAMQDNCVVFVEVKTRRDRLFIEPEKAIDYRKLHNLRTAINHFVKFKNIRQPIRLDAITIVGTPEQEEPEITHIRDFPMY